MTLISSASATTKRPNLMVTENEALKVWIYKAILTERYRYLAYDDSYGITIEPSVGESAKQPVYGRPDLPEYPRGIDGESVYCPH